VPAKESYQIQGRTVTLPCDVRDASSGDVMYLVPASEGVRLVLGDHPLAKELCDLGLPKDPILSNWTEHMRGSFGPSIPL